MKAKDRAEILELIREAIAETTPNEAKQPQRVPEAPRRMRPEESFIVYYSGAADTPEAVVAAKQYTLEQRVACLEETRTELVARLRDVSGELAVRRKQLAQLPGEQALLSGIDEKPIAEAAQ
jgi:hypothetical protein